MALFIRSPTGVFRKLSYFILSMAYRLTLPVLKFDGNQKFRMSNLLTRKNNVNEISRFFAVRKVKQTPVNGQMNPLYEIVGSQIMF
jgi:hypothetical protein